MRNLIEGLIAMGTCLPRSTRVGCVEKGLFPSLYRYEEPDQGKHYPLLNL